MQDPVTVTEPPEPAAAAPDWWRRWWRRQTPLRQDRVAMLAPSVSRHAMGVVARMGKRTIARED